jgi:hypothetical protein
VTPATPRGVVVTHITSFVTRAPQFSARSVIISGDRVSGCSF